MPLKLPNLDDRTYDDLVKEGLALIQSSSTHWTNHNPSDPGIALVEVFAYLTEMLLYRLNKISDENQRAFIRLLRGPNEKTEEGKSLDEEILDTIRDLRKPWRAVTQSDYERLALEFDPTSFEEYYDKIAEELKWNDEKYKKYKDDYFQLKVRRAHCISFNDSVQDGYSSQGYNKIYLVIINDKTESEILSCMLQKAIELYLEPRRLLTTNLRVLKPKYLEIGFDFKLHLFRDANEVAVKDEVQKAILDWLDPFKGGPDGQGWPLGEDIYTSTIYAILDNVPGVDWVDCEKSRDQIKKVDRIRIKPIDEDKRVVCVTLEPHELPKILLDDIKIRVLES